jgi:predicted PurR-regulated permease PerM
MFRGVADDAGTFRSRVYLTVRTNSCLTEALGVKSSFKEKRMEPLSNKDAAPEVEGPQRNIRDLVIRVALVGGLVLLCYRVFSPFLGLMAWAIILAVTLYPLHQKVARKVKQKQWLASVLIVVVGILVIVVPTALLLNSLADSVRGFIADVNNNTLEIPPPNAGVQNLPLLGDKLFEYWSKAHSDLPGLVQSLQPKLGELASRALAAVASIGTALLLFIASFIVAGILMAYGESGERSSRSIFTRIMGDRGEALLELSVSTIRAVALGVIGIAFIQAILVGLSLFISGIPAAGVLAIIMLVLGIAQVPALIITIPAIVYMWASGMHDTGMAIAYTVMLIIVGMADNVLKPLLLGRGVAVPMPVILLGALGGMATGGILGMFVGATALALGYAIFMAWVRESEPNDEEQVVNGKTGDPTPTLPGQDPLVQPAD